MSPSSPTPARGCGNGSTTTGSAASWCARTATCSARRVTHRTWTSSSPRCERGHQEKRMRLVSFVGADGRPGYGAVRGDALVDLGMRLAADGAPTLRTLLASGLI